MNNAVANIQELLNDATTSLPIATEYKHPTPGGIFMPPSHVKALRLQTQLVIGARGVGKTFWAQVLRQDETRKMLELDIPELTNVRVITGYGNENVPDLYPSPAHCSYLLKRYDAEDIWRAILMRGLIRQLENSPPHSFPTSSWEETILAFKNDPEAFDYFLYRVNDELASNNIKILILFDALDRAGESWGEIDKLTYVLLRMVLQFSTYSNIKFKIFLREDHYNRTEFTFPDASKLLATRVDLTWSRSELYSLLWKHLCNSTGGGANTLREIFEKHIPDALQERDGIWFFRRSTNLSDDTLRPLFHELTGPFMGTDKRRGVPYIWTVGHLADTRQQTSPRSFLAAIRRACEDSYDNHPQSEFAIHYESIKRGVQAASEIRVNEMQEDNPWVEKLLTLLQGRNVPCSFNEIEDIWSAKYPTGPGELVEEFPQQAPPEFKDKNWSDVRDMLERLGFCMTLNDGRFNMPDLYRLGFRLGRKGGVPPLP